jgi:hypothetical protein
VSDLLYRAEVDGDALAALSEGVLGPDAPETRALGWLTHHAVRGDLRPALAEIGVAVDEGPGIAYRLYRAVTIHFEEHP